MIFRAKCNFCSLHILEDPRCPVTCFDTTNLVGRVACDYAVTESSLSFLLRHAFRSDTPTCMQKLYALNHSWANCCLVRFRGFLQFCQEFGQKLGYDYSIPHYFLQLAIILASDAI
jgi:hypothetical protein